ncbi:hypothetical protein [Planococcus maritimus]|nr:hypothetical protein [Planococcus maritimus]
MTWEAIPPQAGNKLKKQNDLNELASTKSHSRRAQVANPKPGGD